MLFSLIVFILVWGVISTVIRTIYNIIVLVVFLILIGAFFC